MRKIAYCWDGGLLAPIFESMIHAISPKDTSLRTDDILCTMGTRAKRALLNGISTR